MASARLDKLLLTKLVKKTRRTPQRVRELISQRASRWKVPSEVAQVIWADQFGISTAAAFRSLPPHLQNQVRDQAASLRQPSPRQAARRPTEGHTRRRPSTGVREIVRVLLVDDELRDRCADLLKGRKKFDRPVNQATLVLEERLRKLGGIQGKIVGVDLVARVLHSRTPLLRISNENDVQDGMFSICKGIVSVFRNPTHHRLTDEFSREDALRVCGFVDAVLRILDRGQQMQPGTNPTGGPSGPTTSATRETVPTEKAKIGHVL